MRTVLALFLCLVSFPATAAPWSITGQSILPAHQWVWNPSANFTGSMGETDFPYEVPIGCTLTVTAMGVEAYNVHGQVGMFMYTGDTTPPTDPAELMNWQIASAIPYSTMTVTATKEFNETTGIRYVWPELTVINLALGNGSTDANNWRFGWYVSGDLDCKGI